MKNLLSNLLKLVPLKAAPQASVPAPMDIDAQAKLLNDLYAAKGAQSVSCRRIAALKRDYPELHDAYFTRAGELKRAGAA